MDEVSGLRATRRTRVRTAIVDAALELMVEHGFDAVTVPDIAARAEVSRATFFRYFPDKQEVVFATDEQLGAALDAAARTGPVAPLTSLQAALRHAATLVVALAQALAARPDAWSAHLRLIAAHPELQARSLLKQRGYADRVAATLLAYGADASTARLAAELGLACYLSAVAEVGTTAAALPDQVRAAFARLDAGAPGRAVG